MNWFFIALIAPALWSISSHLDKYLIEKYFKNQGTGALIIFSSLIGFFILPFILVIYPDVLDIKPIFALLIILNGFIYISALFPYLRALKKDETSNIIPFFQTVPVFGYILGYFFLGESLISKQIIAALLIISGAVILSLELQEKKIKFKKIVLGLMLSSSFLFALNGFIFKYVAIQENFWQTSFWEYVGFAIFALFLLIFFKSYREQFISVIKRNKAFVLSLNGLNEVINIVGKVAMNYATLLAPLAIVALTVNGFQPFFVFLFGIIITLFFPRLAKESLIKKDLLQKFLAILIMFFGVYLLTN